MVGFAPPFHHPTGQTTMLLLFPTSSRRRTTVCLFVFCFLGEPAASRIAARSVQYRYYGTVLSHHDTIVVVLLLISAIPTPPPIQSKAKQSKHQSNSQARQPKANSKHTKAKQSKNRSLDWVFCGSTVGVFVCVLLLSSPIILISCKDE